MNHETRTAVVTGTSRGLGLALTAALAADGWRVIATARHADELLQATETLGSGVVTIIGDINDERHRLAIASAVGSRLDLLVNNASSLGPSPLPRLADVDDATLDAVLRTNTIAPLQLFRAVRPALLAAGGMVVNITSDAAHGAWPGWGVYGSSKAALEQWTAVLGAEEEVLAVYSFDPGDMRTRMHQEAFPGEDISDRADPETVAPVLLRLVERRPPNGRYSIDQLRQLETV